MSKTSPADLAVAFRSIHRRSDEALEPVGGDRSVAHAELHGLDRVIAETAEVLGTRADADAIAQELMDRPADAWRAGELDQVRELALRAGQLLRSMETTARRHADE